MTQTTDFSVLLGDLGSEEFTVLRPAQEAVLSAYSHSLSEVKDVAVELPTGAGKSLISLLIGTAWNRQGKSAAILTGNKTLARQMVREGESLGTGVVLMEGRGEDIPAKARREYRRGRKIAVMNYWVYFNQNPVVDPAHLLIMDDAHLAEGCLSSLYSVEISRVRHSELFEKLAGEIVGRFPEYSVLRDALTDGAPNTLPPELLSYLDQDDFADRFREIVDIGAGDSEDKDLRFRWNRLREQLPQSHIYLSRGAIWVRPGVYPLRDNGHYSGAEQRLYMSATIGDTSDLARRLGTLPIKKVPVNEPSASETQGRRMIVLAGADDEEVSERLGAVVEAALEVQPKSVWLCSSSSDAEDLQDLVGRWLEDNNFHDHPTWLLTSLGNEIEEFKESDKGHLFVGGRFDGMDFSADECRLVVLNSLPKAINLQEEFFTAHLQDAGFMLRRLNQRIVQALGRCNRSEDDFAIYVLADKRFSTHFGRESQRVGLPISVCAEVDLAEDALDENLEQLRNRTGEFLNGNFDRFDRDMEVYLEDARLEYEESPAPEDSDADGNVAEPEIAAWAKMYGGGDFGSAAELFEKAADNSSAAGTRQLAGFLRYCEAKAKHLAGSRSDKKAVRDSHEVMQRAIECGSASSWFNRLRSSLNRTRSTGRPDESPKLTYPLAVIDRWNDLLEKYGAKGHRFPKWEKLVGKQLRSGSHGEFQAGLRSLGEVLGYVATTPEYGASTDCRWRGVFGNHSEVFTFEAKIEHEPSNKITPTAVGQANIQFNRAVKEYDQSGYIVRGMIVTHLEEVDPSAESSLGGVRILRRDDVVAVWDRVSALLSEYRENWDLEDVNVRLDAADRIVNKLPRAGWLVESIDEAEAWVPAEAVAGKWGG